MKKDGLLVIDILTVLLIIVITFFPLEVMRIILGLPVALFFPGYTLLAALFPKRSDFSTIERVALSLGVSVLVVALIGFILNYTPWGVRLYPVLLANTLFIVLTSLVAVFRRRNLSPEERCTTLSLGLPKWAWASRLDRGLFVLLVLAIVLALGSLGYAMTITEVGEKFTRFYITGAEGQMENYPKNLAVGEEAKVRLGIVNEEHQDMSYRIEVVVDGVKNGEIGPVALPYRGKWENDVSFKPTRAGENQKVDFLLYRLGDASPYLTLYLWINVD